MLDKLQKIYAQTLIKPYLTWYLKKERITKLKGFHLLVKPTVFHPKYFFSSLYLFDFISSLDLFEKKFLEIGSGSGLISLLAYQKKAIVTCCDINPVAVDCTSLNFVTNFSSEKNNFEVLQSDLFNHIPGTNFDTIVINPPYFFEEINSEHQYAWNCGKNGEYFQKLFSQLNGYIHPKTEIYMILAHNCDLTRIEKLAEAQNFLMILADKRKIKWEVNYVFKIISK